MHYCSFSIRDGLEHLILIILIINTIVSYDQNISLIFYVKDESHMSGCDIRLVFTLPPRDSTLHGTKDAYNSEITFLTLHPCFQPCHHSFIIMNMCSVYYMNLTVHISRALNSSQYSEPCTSLSPLCQDVPSKPLQVKT